MRFLIIFSLCFLSCAGQAPQGPVFHPPVEKEGTVLLSLDLEGGEMIDSNVVSLRTRHPLKAQGVKPYRIVEKKGLKVAFISVRDWGKSIRGPADERSGIYIQDPVVPVLKFKNELREKEKVKAIILLVRNSRGPREVEKIARRLPPKAINLIVSNAQPTGGLTMVNDIPILYTDGGEGLPHLAYEEETGQLSPLKDK